jgi:hypothetical protein
MGRNNTEKSKNCSGAEEWHGLRIGAIILIH